jgi:glycosyltransferase involved in cell wall biosynthesis
VFHFNFGKTLLKNNRDIPFLKSLGKKLVMEFWGNDARIDNMPDQVDPRRLSRKKRGKILDRFRKLGRYIDVALVADLELKGYVESFFKRVELIPQRIELDIYVPRYPDPAKKRPLVVHAPTDRDIKGTAYVLDAVQKLMHKHSFDFYLIEGKKHSEARELYANADVVVDQLRIGTYGVLAVESMALGKPVITHIRDDVRGGYPETLPIVAASQESICEALDRVIAHGTLRHDLGVQSRRYVEEYHDSIKVARRLHCIYQSI